MYFYEFVNLKNRGCFLRGKIRVFDEIGGYFRLGIPRIGGYFQNPRQSVYPLAQLSGGGWGPVPGAFYISEAPSYCY